MNRGSIAASVRRHRESHPELYCSVRGCLWRTVTSRGPSPCLKHGVAPLARVGSDYTQPIEETPDENVAEAQRLCAKLMGELATEQLWTVTVAFWSQASDEIQYKDITVSAPDAETAEELATERLLANSGECFIESAKAVADAPDDAETAQLHADPDADCKCSACRRHRRAMDTTLQETSK